MDALMQFLRTTLQPVVLIFTVMNLAAMGLQVRLPQVATALKNRRAIALIFVWGWVLGPAFGYLITMVLPLAEPYEVVILLACLAPCAPILQQMVGKARGDVGFAGAFIPIVTVATVVLMPLLAPAADQRADGQPGGTRKTASTHHPAAAGDRGGDPALRRQGGHQDLPGGQGTGLALHAAVSYGVWRSTAGGCSTRPGSLPSCDDSVHGRDGSDHLPLQLRPKPESTQRHVDGDGRTEWRGDLRVRVCHAERGPAHHSYGRHVGPMVHHSRADLRQNLRQAGRQGRYGKSGSNITRNIMLTMIKVVPGHLQGYRL